MSTAEAWARLDGVAVDRIDVGRGTPGADVELSVATAGDGPPVVLLHGFPELGWSWRHQVPALAEAGYRAIVPDQRGYGDSSRPEAIDDYAIFHLVGDVVTLVEEVAGGPAVVVGHDWGSMVAWHAALFRPDLVKGVVGMSVPYVPRGPISIPAMLRMVTGDGFNYILHFQEPGVAEADLEADVAETLRRTLWMASGARPAEARQPERPTGFADVIGLPDGLPPFITAEEFEVYVEAFRRTGFSGGVNWYRNMDANWARTAAWHNAPVRVPAGFVGGLRDFVVSGAAGSEEPGPGVEMMRGACEDLRVERYLPGVGHWNMQEDPAGTNEGLLAFLDALS